MFRRMAIVVACIAASHGVAHAGAWAPYGIPDLAPNVLATHQSLPGFVFAGFGSPTTTIMASEDGGQHWRSTFRFDPTTLQAVNAPWATVVGSPPEIYANISAVPWWSNDAGRSWAYVPWWNYPPVDVDNGGHQLGGVNPANPGERVVYHESSMAITSNYGATWRVDAVPFAVRSMRVDWVARRVYATGIFGWAGKGLDVAGPWITQSPHSPFAAKNGVVIAYSGGGGLLRSPDGGATFVPVAQSLGNINACAIEFAPSSNLIAYVMDCGTPFRTLRSTDAGATWSAVGGLDPEPGGQFATVTLAIDGTDPNVLLMGDRSGIRKSIDGGATFPRLSRATGSPGVARQVLFDATNPQRQWMGGGVLVTQDHGATWQEIVDPNFSRQVIWSSRTRSNVVLLYQAGGPHSFNVVSLSTDGGATRVDKITTHGGDAGRNAVVDGSQPGELYLFQKEGGTGAEYIYVSINDGESFVTRGPTPAYSLSASASRTGPTVLYYGVEVPGNSIGLYRSTDQAVTSSAVTTIPVGGAVSAVAVAPSNAEVVYIGYKNPSPYAIYRSVDGGVTWQVASSGLGTGPVTSIIVDPVTPDTLYAAQNGSGVFRSTDGGSSWKAMDDGLLGAAEDAQSLQLDPHDANRLYQSTAVGQFVVDLSTGTPAGDRRAIEFYYPAFDHYFVSADLDEIAGLDAGVFPGWSRTGESFRVAEGATTGFQPVCRFFGVGFQPLASHFYTPYAKECDILKNDPKWVYEKIAFGLATPDPATSGCPLDTRPLYRLFNRNAGGAPNHRYTTHTATFDAMLNRDWTFEGNSATRVFACVPN